MQSDAATEESSARPPRRMWVVALVVILWLGPPIYLWDRVEAPVGAAALWLGIGSLFLVKSAALRLVAMVLVGIGGVEVALCALAPPRGSTQGADVYEDHPVLGFTSKPGASDRSEHRFGNEVIFSVVYSIDDEGLRVAPAVDESPTQSVLCFGCSFMFGIGIEDDEAVPYRLQEELGSAARVYNLACGGWGTHQSLAMLEIGRVEEVVDEPPLVAVYWCLPDHIYRTAGKRYWDRSGPLYEVDGEGRAERVGSFRDLPAPPPAPGQLTGIRKKSWIARRIVAEDRKEESLHPDPKDVERWAAVMRKMRDEIAARFDGCPLHVFLDDRSERGRDEVRQVLEDLEIPYTLRSTVLVEDPENLTRWVHHRTEWHPNRDAADLVAKHLLREVVLPRLEDSSPR